MKRRARHVARKQFGTAKYNQGDKAMRNKPCLAGIVMALCALMAPLASVGNNVQVSNASLYDLHQADGYIYVKFDVNWANSWRTSTYESNWDGVWTFVKYKDGSGNWKHATLSTNATDHKVPASAMINVGANTNKGMGAFIYRSGNGTGDVSYANVKLLWNYTADGLSLQPGNQVDFCVFAIEMVYIPQGSFYVGDGTVSDIKGQFESGTNGTPFQITNESYSITLGGGAPGSLGNNNALTVVKKDDFSDTNSVPLPAEYPKGFNAFWCMKYEISQGQYADFLNTLTPGQTNNRYKTTSSGSRYTITNNAGVFTAARPDRACNFLSWGDGVAYADWAGLRPMTELEFEKVCRGPVTPVKDEYAWGTNAIYYISGSSPLYISGAEDGTEYISNNLSAGAASYNNTAHSGGDVGLGPLRCGIFAGKAGTRTRADSGATYYGVMEMSGNLWEWPVTLGNTTGRAFTGTHGDGALTSSGNADVGGWPADANGTGRRGGGWNDYSWYLRISDRYLATKELLTREAYTGWRGVRTAPQ